MDDLGCIYFKCISKSWPKWSVHGLYNNSLKKGILGVKTEAF